MADDISPRVLSIQSHVVSGYCGNKSAVFPLQVLGFEVDFINSVQYSNLNYWYKVYDGQELDADDLSALYKALCTNDLNRYSHVLTGYIATKSFLEKVCEVVKDLKEKNPGLKYVCDPVLGDGDQKYVPEELIAVYEELVIPLADVITPNQSEAEWLTGLKITCEEDALTTMEALHKKGPRTVVLTSTDLVTDNLMIGYASSIQDERSCIRMKVPKLDAYFTGTGDLFTALWLAWSRVHPDDIHLVANKVQSTMQKVIARTYNSAYKQSDNPQRADLELKLIQSKKDIEHPELCITVEKIM